MKFGHILAALALLTVTTTLHADDYTHKATGLRFTLPNGWAASEQGDKLVITNEDNTLAVVGGVIEKAAAQAIFDDIESFVDKLDGLNDVEVVDGPEKEEVNGLEQAWYDGTGTLQQADGSTEEVEWDMTIVSGGKNLLFLVGIGKLDDNEKVYEEFFESIENASGDAAE